MPSNTNFEAVQHSDSTTNTNFHPFVDEMEPGVIYGIEPGKATIQRLKRRNAQLKKRLRFAKICNIVIGIVFLVMCFFSYTKFRQLNERFNELSKQYDNIISANHAVATKSNIVADRIADYYIQRTNLITIIPTDEEIVENEVDKVIEEEVEEITITFPKKYKNIPLDDKLKEYIYTSAKAANIPPEVMFSLAWKESSFNPNAKSATDDHGLFQINECNFKELAEHFGYTYKEFCEKIYDPYVNTDCSIYVLLACRDYYNNDNWHHVLMRYNMGPGRTNELFAEGIYSSKYSRAILNYASNTFGFNNIELD